MSKVRDTKELLDVQGGLYVVHGTQNATAAGDNEQQHAKPHALWGISVTTSGGALRAKAVVIHQYTPTAKTPEREALSSHEPPHILASGLRCRDSTAVP